MVNARTGASARFMLMLLVANVIDRGPVAGSPGNPFGDARALVESRRYVMSRAMLSSGSRMHRCRRSCVVQGEALGTYCMNYRAFGRLSAVER